MNFGPPNYRDQGVYGDYQSGFSDHQPGVGTERKDEQRGRDVEHVDDFSRGMRGDSPVYDLYTGLLGKEKEKSLDSYGSWDAGSEALKISTSSSTAPTSNSKPETLRSPYGDYDMDDSSFFAHTTRLNIVGPNPNSTQLLRRRSSSTERLLINRGERSMTTAATSFQKTDRSPSPPIPSVPEKLTLPTESYLQLSLQPSPPLADPTASRKLLVLDLNGSLLLRSPYSRHRSYVMATHSLIGNTVTNIPAGRAVHPRPYIPSFCAYIFHPTTLQWLDTMVWSSAQRQNVDDMVDKCFGEYKEGLKAVWARNTFGLSKDEYYKKTLTLKDLAKPWAHIPSIISNQSRPENSNPKVDADTDNHPSIPQQEQQHSALTTILLDDSINKASLQPWNHLRISEYTTERRKLDVMIAKWRAEYLERNRPEEELEPTGLAERDRVKEIAEGGGEKTTTRDGTCADVDMAAMKSGEEADTDLVKLWTGLKESLRIKRLKNRVGGRGVGVEGYDELLLGVIGILDALKHEGNVAGWIRSGGLVNVYDDQETVSRRVGETPVTTTTTTINPILNPQTNTLSLLGSKRDSPTVPIEGPSKRRRLTLSQTDMELDGERTLEMDSDPEMVVLPTTPPTATSTKKRSVYSSLEQLLEGGPLSTTTAEEAAKSSTTRTSGNVLRSTTPIPETQSQTRPVWYEIPYVFSHWVLRGRMALAELEIEIIHGVKLQETNGIPRSVIKKFPEESAEYCSERE